jgi:hypothetical protein
MVILSLSSVIVGDFDFMRPIFIPDEADTVLIIDSDAELSKAIFLQSLEPVVRRNAQVLKVHCRIDLIELSAGYRSDCRPPSIGASFKELSRIVVSKALNHFELKI